MIPSSGTDDVDDAPLRAAQAEQLNTESRAVLFQLAHLLGSRLDRDRRTSEDLLGARRSGVIHGRQGEIEAAHRQAPLPQDREGLRRSDLVDQVQIDIQDSGRIGAFSRDLVCGQTFSNIVCAELLIL